MGDHEETAQRFERYRSRLEAVAYRMLGSKTEAEDAVQECWLHLSRSDAGGIDNIGGWLTTVVARICLDMLRSRKARREDPHGAEVPEPAVRPDDAVDPEKELLLADSVGLALLVVLDTLTPPERLAFVLHEMFGVPFDEIARIMGRSPEAARQLASRARRRVHGTPALTEPELSTQRDVVAAFLAAVRDGDFDALVAVLDPDVVVRADAAVSPPAGNEVRGARTWAKGAVRFARAVGLGSVEPVLIDGQVGLVLAPGGRLERVLRFTFAHGKIAGVEIVADPARLRDFTLAVVPE